MQILANQALPGETAATQPGSGANSNTSNAAAGSATVTANDFLQLLVAEMKNQDPTNQTDPTQYIDQLVQVNSLEQLVQINQDLGGGTSATSSNNTHAVAPGTAQHSATAPGNLSTGPADRAATRVASALGNTRSAAGPFLASPAPAGNPFDAIVAARRGRAAAQPTTTNPAR